MKTNLFTNNRINVRLVQVWVKGKANVRFDPDEELYFKGINAIMKAHIKRKEQFTFNMDNEFHTGFSH